VTATCARTSGETVAGSPYTISAVLSPVAVLGNYAITFNTAPFTIAPRAASATANPATKIYGNADPVFAGTLSGFVATDGVTATFARTAGETVAGSPYTISAVLSPAAVLGNYAITFNTALFAITPRAASVTPNAATKIYGNADPVLTGILSGFVAADGVTATYTRTAGETVAGSPYTISAVLSPAAMLGNYAITFNTALFAITPAPLVAKADDKIKIQGSPNPPLTGTVTGIKFNDPITATYTTTADQTSPVGTYPIVPALNDPAGKLGNYAVTIINGTLTVTTATTVSLQAQAIAARDALAALLPTGNRDTDSKLREVLRELDAGLDPTLWADGNHLTPQGRRVFGADADAVEDLMRLRGPVPIAAAIATLVAIDRELAATAIRETPPSTASRLQRELQLAAASLAEGDRQRDRGRFDQAIEEYGEAWHHAMRANGITIDHDSEDHDPQGRDHRKN
jgi:MBG domain (YGX type)